MAPPLEEEEEEEEVAEEAVVEVVEEEVGVVAFSRANGRFTVKLDQYDLRLICPEGKTLRLLPTNLQACDKAAASS